MRILLTGTHFTPAVAVIEALRDYDPKIELFYVGRKTTREGDKSPSAESHIIPEMGVKFIPLTTGRVQRTFTRYTIPSLFKIPWGIIQGFWIVLTKKPDVVVSFGGYVGFPLVFSAWLLSIPVIIHEQTLIAGMANKVSSWFATKVAVSFPGNHEFNKGKVVFTGNPMRKELLRKPKSNASLLRFFRAAKQSHKKVIFITGGNQGSHIINKVVGENLEDFLSKYFIIHQTGDSFYHDDEVLEKKRRSLSKYSGHYLVSKFIREEMGFVLRNVDLVISRAGINTLTELAYLKKRAVVIPIPYIYKDEQNVNAHFFAEHGLVEVLPQSELSGESLVQSISKAFAKRNSLDDVSKVVVPDAASRITFEILLLVRDAQI